MQTTFRTIAVHSIADIVSLALQTGILTEKQCQAINRILYDRQISDADDLAALEQLIEALDNNRVFREGAVVDVADTLQAE